MVAGRTRRDDRSPSSTRAMIEVIFPTLQAALQTRMNKDGESLLDSEQVSRAFLDGILQCERVQRHNHAIIVRGGSCGRCLAWHHVGK